MADALIEVDHGISLRPVEFADRDFLRDLYATTRADELSLVPWPDNVKQAFIDQQFSAQDSYYRQVYPDASFMVIEVDGRAVGRWYVAELAAELRLIEVTIAPIHRGQGIGTRLLAGLCAEADRRGFPIRLHVEPWNAARRLYERFGFVQVGDADGIYQRMDRAPA